MKLSIKNVTSLLGVGLAVLLTLSVAILYLHGDFSLPNKERSAVCVNYDKQKRIITVACNSTFSELNEAIADDSILTKQSTQGAWLLNSSVVVLKGANLTFRADDGNYFTADTNWLKISSVGNSIGIRNAGQYLHELTPYRIQIFGAIQLDGVKITSWNPQTNNYATQRPDGTVPRPYITIEEQADPSHIVDSEIAYLGYDSPRKKGINFYGGDRSTLVNNRIHDLWYGFFSTNVGHMVLDNNLVSNNFKYGIDPHKGSHDMLFKNNQIFNSRIGLICSLDCVNVVFEHNRIENNKEIGLMLSRNTVNSTVRFNTISNSDVGISISESKSNKIHDNAISRNNIGLTIKDDSSHNLSLNNTITYSKNCALAVVLGAQNNMIKGNYIENYNEGGICLSKHASQNIFYSNVIRGLGKYGIYVKDRDAVANTFQDNMIPLANNAIRVYNNTDTVFINSKVGTSNAHQYIISGNSTLNLEKSLFLEDRVRAAGKDGNIIKIWNSGVINIVTGNLANETKTVSYDTDVATFVANLTYTTIMLYSKSG